VDRDQPDISSRQGKNLGGPSSAATANRSPENRKDRRGPNAAVTSKPAKETVQGDSRCAKHRRIRKKQSIGGPPAHPPTARAPAGTRRGTWLRRPNVFLNHRLLAEPSLPGGERNGRIGLIGVRGQKVDPSRWPQREGPLFQRRGQAFLTRKTRKTRKAATRQPRRNQYLQGYARTTRGTNLWLQPGREGFPHLRREVASSSPTHHHPPPQAPVQGTTIRPAARSLPPTTQEPNPKPAPACNEARVAGRAKKNAEKS